MKILDKILEFKKAAYITAAIIFLCSLVVLSCFKSAETQLSTLNSAASLSRTMAKSSDDLTNYARYFVTTKNEQWRTDFNNVLKVRSGEMADENGVTKSFKERVKEVPFLQSELDKLLKAEQLSNELAKLEIQAFKHIDDYKAEREPEKYAERQAYLAVQAEIAMFGDDYKKYKKEIMNTTSEFYVMVNSRLHAEYMFYMKAAWTMIIMINLSLIFLVMIIRHKEVVTKKIPKKKTTRKVKQDDRTS